jgi:hypothetical protein
MRIEQHFGKLQLPVEEAFLLGNGLGVIIPSLLRQYVSFSVGAAQSFDRLL